MRGDRLKLLPKNCIPLLTTESFDEFGNFREKIWRDINPRNELERIYCDDIVNLSWDILRLRRWKVAILNLAFVNASYEILVEKLDEVDRGQETVDRLKGWFGNERDKREVLEILEKYGLDESVIEAEAFRQCAAELTLIEQLLAAAENRRAKAIQQIGLLARELRNMTIDVTPTPQLSSPKKSSAG